MAPGLNFLEHTLYDIPTPLYSVYIHFIHIYYAGWSQRVYCYLLPNITLYNIFYPIPIIILAFILLNAVSFMGNNNSS